jgi:hypothetical protein
VAGGCSGSAGGVGEAVGPDSAVGATGGVVSGAPGSASPVHAASVSATNTEAIAPRIARENVVENLC